MSTLPAIAPLDVDSHEWPRSLRAIGRTREAAIARLHALLLRAARFEVTRRRQSLQHLRSDELDDIAVEAANDALVSVLARLDDFRGASRFSTWVYKFALREASVKLRQRAWQARELPIEPEGWSEMANVGAEPDAQVEQRELMTALQAAIVDELTPHQRRVLVAVALSDVPIDVLAERLGTTRGALYKTLHDARNKLRRHLAASGFDTSVGEEGS